MQRRPRPARRLLYLLVALPALAFLTAQIVLAAPPAATFTISDVTAARGQTITFDATATDPDGDTISSYEWSFGDGTSGSGQNVTHAYAATTSLGTKTVSLTVTDSANETMVVTEQVTVQNATPNSAFSVSDATPVAGQTVIFDGSGSSDFEGPIADTNHDWDLDGNGSFESTGKTPSRSYSTAGPVTVALQVTDSNGATDTATQTLTVSPVINTPPTAVVTMNHVDESGGAPGVPDVGETVNFNGSLSAAGEPSDSISRYEWDLDGDPSTGTGGFEVNTGSVATISRSYSTPGSVTVRLRVTDGAGDTDVTSAPSLTFNALPVARIGILNPHAETGQKPGVPLAGQAFEFTAGAMSATGGAPPATGCPATAGSPASPGSTDLEDPIASYHWELDGDGDFNDATGKEASSPSGGFPAGMRTVGLLVFDSTGATDSATLTFRVNTPPAPGFVLEPLTPVIGQQVTFSTTSGDPDAADSGQLVHSWDLDDDGNFCEAGEQGPSTKRTFATAGSHTVKLRVTDTGGVTRELTREVLVQNTIPAGSFGFSPDAPLPGQPVTFNGSASSPTGKAIAALEWNFDFDPATFDAATDRFGAQATGARVSRSFATPGPRTVALKISEVGGGFRIVTGTIVVNARPIASFSISGESPFAGIPVTISSTSADPDGPLAGQQWDLDNDGQFDDAAGPVVFTTFAQAGVHTLALRVTDTRGAGSTAVRQITVRAVPPPPAQLLQGVLIRIKGSVLGPNTMVRRLVVRAPRGANVLVRCRGTSCPRKARTASRLSKGGPLRFKKLERRMRPGTRIKVQVTKPGFVGRVTTFRMRKRAAPRRTDLCLPPGARNAIPCAG